MRLTADADAELWVPITGSMGFKGRRHRKTAIRMLMTQTRRQLGMDGAAGKFGAWAISQAAPALIKRADGRMLAWVWRDDAELLFAIAQTQEMTANLRAARAMAPMEYDDTVDFRNPHLGTGEKLVLDLPRDPNQPPTATYTWDTGTHLITLSAMCSDRARFGTVIGPLDDLARSLRIADDVEAGETDVLRLPPQ
ncbi:hypothetical protein [Microbacterium halophytorum]|uniref:hypothetical protein n=1 Tax=Microbacterium halophytorum TaxID=2067568 RepID=UPI000CFB90B4|nr:hypothetical protein [Microbacterium halophytorum]